MACVHSLCVALVLQPQTRGRRSSIVGLGAASHGSASILLRWCRRVIMLDLKTMMAIHEVCKAHVR